MDQSIEREQAGQSGGLEQPSVFGDLLRSYRRAAGLTQEALAERATVSARAVADLERGVNRAPRKDTLRLLMAALGLSARDRARFEAAAARLPLPASQASALWPGGGAGLLPRGGAHPPLAGRAREIDLLEHHLAGEGPTVLLLSGEPGIGKTRLLHEAAVRAPGYGWRVLQGGCQRRGVQEPYAPIPEALERHVRQQSAAQRRIEMDGCGWLVRLLPELAETGLVPLPSWTLEPAQEQRLMFKAVARLLTNVAGPGGTLLVLDDLQWADQDALELLLHVVRAVADVPLRIVGAYRDTEAQPHDALATALGDLAHGGLLAHHALGRLDPEDSGRLLDALLQGEPALTPEEREGLARRGEGVPFFIVTYADWVRLPSPQGSGPETMAPGTVPRNILHGIRQRVAVLPAEAQAALDVAAVVGRVAPPVVLADVLGRAEGDVLVALDTACRARLLDVVEDAYRFTHDVIREAIESDLSMARRAALHRLIADAFVRAPGAGSVELIAHHYSRGTDGDKAAAYVEQAGDQARARYANAAARTYYRDAVDRLDRLDRRHDAAPIREKLGAVLMTVALHDEALAVLERANEAYGEAADAESVRRVTADISRVYTSKGMPDEAIARVRPLLDDARAGIASLGVASLHVVLAGALITLGRHDEALAAATSAADAARVLRDNRLQAEAECQRGDALGSIGRLDESIQALSRANGLADAVGDLQTVSFALNSAAHTYLLRGELPLSREHIERALSAAERIGERTWMTFETMHRAFILFWSGEWVQARADSERAISMSQEIGASYASAPAHQVLGLVSIREGRWDEGLSYLREGVALAERGNDVESIRQGHGMLAEMDLLSGQPGAALARLLPLLDGADRRNKDVAFLLPRLAWAYLMRGDIDAAKRVIAEAVARAQASAYHLALVDMRRVQAMVAMEQGQWLQAARALDDGLALARRMPCPYAEGRLLSVYAELDVRTGEPEAARGHGEAARVIFQRLGARWDVEQVDDALGRRASQAAAPRADLPAPL